ncbi:N-terminal kinase-like protein, partial [Opisthocomus hoazin]|uniref:N-terminal kinase-like protein n=1 Tax=Opisthocomus hoazin TaxID=30419 RepID=UPI003F53D000
MSRGCDTAGLALAPAATSLHGPYDVTACSCQAGGLLAPPPVPPPGPPLDPPARRHRCHLRARSGLGPPAPPGPPAPRCGSSPGTRCGISPSSSARPTRTRTRPGPGGGRGPGPALAAAAGTAKGGRGSGVGVRHGLGTGDAAATNLARAALRRLRSLRHPSVVAFLDSLETEQCLYLVTEPVTPLRRHLRLRPPTGALGEQEVAWGLHQLLAALTFLGGSGLVHHALALDAIFVDPGGDWKLGGLERVAAAGEGVPPRPPGTPPRPHDPPSSATPPEGRGSP